MAVHPELSKKVINAPGFQAATVADGTPNLTIDLDTVDIDGKTLAELERAANINGYELKIAKGTAGTGTSAKLTFAPKA